MYINSRISKRTQLLSGIAAVLMLAALVIGCKTNVSNAPETFRVAGKNGNLRAKVDVLPAALKAQKHRKNVR